jgi:hypothetical protein
MNLFLQISMPICTAILSWFLTRRHFYTNLYYTEGIEFIKKFHLPLLTALQNVMFNTRIALKPSLVERDVNIVNESLKVSIESFKKALEEYVKNAGHTILEEIDMDLSKKLLYTLATHDLWASKDNKNCDFLALPFDPIEIQDIYSKLGKISFKNIIESLKHILSGKKSKLSSPKFYNYAYIDSTNVDKSIKEMGWELDAFKFREYLKDKYNIKRAFQIIAEIDEYESLYKVLQNAGFEIRFAPLKKLSNGSTKVDIERAFKFHVKSDMLSGDNCDKILIVSGDSILVSFVRNLIIEEKLLNLMIPNIPDEEGNFHFYKEPEIAKHVVFMNTLEEKLKRR